MSTTTTIRELTESTFEEEVSQPGVQVVDFWAPWCGPCRAMAPQLEKAAQLRPQYRFAKVNVDEQPALAATFRIQAIPTLAVLRDGELVGTASGLVRAESLADALDKVAAG